MDQKITRLFLSQKFKLPNSKKTFQKIKGKFESKITKNHSDKSRYLFTILCIGFQNDQAHSKNLVTFAVNFLKLLSLF